MSKLRRGGNRQPELLPRSKRPAIPLPDNHPMVVLTDTVDWTEMEVRAEKIREKKLKNAAGRPPRRSTRSWARRWLLPAKGDASCAGMPWSRVASSASFTRR